MSLDPDDLAESLYTEWTVPSHITEADVSHLEPDLQRLWQWINDQSGPVTEADVELAIITGKLDFTGG